MSQRRNRNWRRQSSLTEAEQRRQEQIMDRIAQMESEAMRYFAVPTTASFKIMSNAPAEQLMAVDAFVMYSVTGKALSLFLPGVGVMLIRADAVMRAIDIVQRARSLTPEEIASGGLEQLHEEARRPLPKPKIVMTFDAVSDENESEDDDSLGNFEYANENEDEDEDEEESGYDDDDNDDSTQG